MQDLGQIQVNQKRTNVILAAHDTPGENTVPSFNGLTLTATPPGIVSFANQTQTADLPAGSTFKFDIIGHVVGAVTITAQGQQGNFMPTFTTDLSFEVVADPNAPGLPDHWVVVDPGQTVAQ
jgi:hypothetical protein